MNRLREWRLNLPGGSTHEAAGRLLGVSAAQMSRYESGARSIPADRVPDVSRLTGIAPNELRPDVFGPGLIVLPEGEETFLAIVAAHDRTTPAEFVTRAIRRRLGEIGIASGASVPVEAAE